MEIISKRRAFPPIIDFENVQHLLNVVMILQITIFLKNIKHPGKKFAKFYLESLISEFRNLFFSFDHLFKSVEVEICLNKMVQGLHCTLMDLVHFLVS